MGFEREQPYETPQPGLTPLVILTCCFLVMLVYYFLVKTSPNFKPPATFACYSIVLLVCYRYSNILLRKCVHVVMAAALCLAPDTLAGNFARSVYPVPLVVSLPAYLDDGIVEGKAPIWLAYSAPNALMIGVAAWSLCTKYLPARGKLTGHPN